MTIALSRGIRAPIEQIYRAVIKYHFLNEAAPKTGEPPMGRMGQDRLLPPYLGEMGLEIRYHLARVEPWIRNGWKVVTRRPAFYPAGTAIDCPEFFKAADEIFKRYGIVPAYGGVYIPPIEFGQISVERKFESQKGTVTLGLSDVRKVVGQAKAEIELRNLFLEWFHFPGRLVSDYDRTTLGFMTTTFGHWQYLCAAALRPGFMPPSFENPPEPVRPHVGVQIRKVDNGLPQPRNSDPAFMLQTARKIAAHLGLDLLVYGHPNGCHVPGGEWTSFDPKRPEGQLERELGYLKSCKVMLGPDSGWCDLMGWLSVPTFLEMLDWEGQFEPLRATFRPRMALFDRTGDLGAQVDALLASDESLLPAGTPGHFTETRLFPWEP